MGEEVASRYRASRQDPWHYRAGKDWTRGRETCPSLRHGDCRLRSLCLPEHRERWWYSVGITRWAIWRIRLFESPRWTNPADREHDQRRISEEDEKGSAAGQLRARRTGRRSSVSF